MPVTQEAMNKIKGRLVVSCQAFAGDPLDDTDALRRIARSAVLGGAAGLRVHSAEHIAAIRLDTDLPIIGIKKVYVDGQLRITPDFESAAELAAAGADIIALDCTNRIFSFGEPWQQCINRIHQELNLLVMADVATYAEAVAAAAAGADMVGMTLNGYTEETKDSRGFSWPLLQKLVEEIGRPIIAEGNISTPAETKRAIEIGAWSVVVGSAITRPGAITTSFVRAITRPTTPASVVGVDIGGTSTKAGLVDREGHVTLLTRVQTNAEGGRDSIAAAAALAIETVLAAAAKEGIEPGGIGIASAGVIDSANGTVFAATDNLPGWTGFDLRGFAANRFRLPVTVHNDAHAAVLAELRFGIGSELSDFVAITMGTGVGGGIVSGGKLLSGQLGFAGSMGHQTIRFDGRPCNCGRLGCLEAYVSAAALVREYQDQQTETTNDTMSATQIGQLALAGDAHALKAYSRLAKHLAEGIANIFNILDPQAILLSGGLIEGHTHFIAAVEREVTSLLHFGDSRKPRIQLCAAGQYAGVQGAAAAIFDVIDG